MGYSSMARLAFSSDVLIDLTTGRAAVGAASE